MPPHALRAETLLAQLSRSLPRSARYAVALRAARASDLALARMLLSADASSPPPLLLAPPLEAQLLRRAHPRAQQHVVTVTSDRAAPLRPYAAAALQHATQHLVLGTTPLERAVAGVSSVSGNALCGDASSGIEMLPDGVLQLHEPFVQLPHASVQTAVAQHVPSHYRSACDARFMPPELITVALQHAQLRRDAVRALSAQSDALLRASVVDASHWGYVVARTGALFSAYNSGRASRLAAVHAMQRLCVHVSGSAKPPALDDAQVARLCDAIFSTDAHGADMRALPKGRTAVGVVLRPATGRFARRLRTSNEQLMMLTREPDHESAELSSTRLRGNYTCAPLDDERAVYWDNRFVLSAASVSALAHDELPQLRPERVFEAALQTNDEHAQRMRDCSLYVRQLRRADWDLISGACHRARQLHIPFECVRALPAVLQKERGTRREGELVAVPHLGLSARPDLYFVAVRLPRFRCLPAQIEPGFAPEQYARWMADSGLAPRDGAGGAARSTRVQRG